MARGLGRQQIWIVEHLRTLNDGAAPTCRDIAAARYGVNLTKGDAEKIRQALHRLHRDGLVTLQRSGRDLSVLWVERQLELRPPNALRRRASVPPADINDLAARLRSEGKQRERRP